MGCSRQGRYGLAAVAVARIQYLPVLGLPVGGQRHLRCGCRVLPVPCRLLPRAPGDVGAAEQVIAVRGGRRHQTMFGRPFLERDPAFVLGHQL